jgi:hypothetical protein
LRIRAPLAGFQVTQCSLATLACLLGETWLEEDVVNALLELLYLNNAILTDSDPTFIALPTSFARDSRYLFEQGLHTYSLNLSLIRRRLRAILTANVSFATCDLDHFSAYRYLPKFSSLRLGDSMGRPPCADILPAFNWVLEGLSGNGYSAPETVGEGHMPQQGSQSGSCGIAAVNFIARGELSNPPLWDDTSSPLFRNKALQDLIVYHFAATEQQSVSRPTSCPRVNLSSILTTFLQAVHTWHTPCTLAPLAVSETLIDDPSQAVGYDDFNLYRPTVYTLFCSYLNIPTFVSGHTSYPSLRRKNPAPAFDSVAACHSPTQRSKGSSFVIEVSHHLSY